MTIPSLHFYVVALPVAALPRQSLLQTRTHTHTLPDSTHTPLPPSNTYPPTHLQEVALVQKLYRLVFLGLTMPDGEALLMPSLVSLLNKCLEAATKQRDPLAYLQLLRVLFRHCYNSREPLKHVYVEVAPHLSGALNTLLAMLDGPNCTEVCVGCVGMCVWVLGVSEWVG